MKYHAARAYLLLMVLFFSCSYLAPRKLAVGPVAGKKEVMFSFYAPSAGRVQLGGDWAQNNWTRGDGSAGETNIGLMSDEGGNGVWEIKIELPPGRYKYLFLVDEQKWYLDPGNAEETDGGPVNRCSQIVLMKRDGRLVLK